MTASITTALMMCIVQVSLVAAFALLLHSLLPKRWTTIRASLAATAVLSIIILTPLAFYPLPSWWNVWPILNAGVAGEEVSQPSDTAVVTLPQQPPSGNTPALQVKNTSAESGGFFFTIRSPLEQLSRLAGSPKTKRGQTVVSLLSTVFLLVLSASLIRLLWSLWGIRQIRRESRPILDEEIVSLIHRFEQAHDTTRRISLAESSRIHTAATIGWRRPLILLPAGWRDWSAAELQVVLAHEVAHIARGDYPLRLAAFVSLTLHVYHPLVHWLVRRLIAEQELAADALAAPLAGGRTRYLRALSRLALRQDGRIGACPTAFALPVSSSFLMRRIDMLRAKDGSAGRRTGGLIQATVIMALVLAATGATAIRTWAQPPAEKPAARVANRNVGPRASAPASPENKTPKNKAAAEKQSSPEDQPFQRKPFDPAMILSGEPGAFVVRPAALFARPELRIFVDAYNGMVIQSLKGVNPEESTLLPRIQDIELITGDLRIKVSKPDVPAQDASLQVGATRMLFRTKTPFDWRTALLKIWPVAEALEQHGHRYLKLPLFPAFGPDRLKVCFPDDRTVLWLRDEDDLERMLAADFRLPTSRSVAQPWKTLSRGVIAVSFDNTAGQLFEALSTKPTWLAYVGPQLTAIRSLSLGVDWSETTDQLSLQMHVVCKKAKADNIEQTCQSLLHTAHLLADQLTPHGEQGEVLVSVLLKLLGNAHVDTKPLSEKESVVVTHTSAPVAADLFGRLLIPVTEQEDRDSEQASTIQEAAQQGGLERR